MPVYSAGTEVKPSEIARQGLEEAKKQNIDVVIVDTAGRLQVLFFMHNRSNMTIYWALFIIEKRKFEYQLPCWHIFTFSF